MEIKCTNCVFCELVVSEGELYTFINPLGDQVSRQHDRTVYICRANPPIGGDWPQVTENDWCGRFEKKEEGEA